MCEGSTCTCACNQSFLAGRTQHITIESQASSTSPVGLGVPQGTVIGPLLFLAYINDLPSRIKATPRLIADGCFLYHIINSPEDTRALQYGLNALQQRAKDWLMPFQVIKRAKIRNRYNLVPHLAHDTNGKVTNSQLDITNEGQEFIPFPAGDHKATINRRTQSISNTRQK